MNNFIPKYLPAICLAATLLAGCKPETGTGGISGFVGFAETRIPIPDVTIQIGDQHRFTDADGTYIFEELPQGRHTLTATRAGYDPVEIEIRISREWLPRDIGMTSEAFTGKTYGTLTGLASGAPMAGLKVVLLNPDCTDSDITENSDPTGAWRLLAVPAGERIVSVALGGGVCYRKGFTAKSPETKLNLLIPEPFNFSDPRDGHVYRAMAIGGNSWMTGNLGWLPDVSPPDAGSDTLPRHYVYDYHGTDAGAAAATVLYTTIGVIYNRVAAAHACPDGWRLPTDDDWLLLDKYLAENGYGYKGSISQTAKAMSSSELWTSTTVSGAPGNSRDPANLSGFQAIPAPGRTASGTFSIAGIRAAFWVAGSAQYRYLSFDRTDILTGTAAPAEGFSVRCVKNSH